VDKQQPDALAAALERVASSAYDPDEVAALANVRSWEQSASELHDSLLRACGRPLETPVSVTRKAA
jgi:hypothetical protein